MENTKIVLYRIDLSILKKIMHAINGRYHILCHFKPLIFDYYRVGARDFQRHLTFV